MEKSFGDVFIDRKTLPSGEMKEVRYQKGNKLGKGGFATCFQVTRIEDEKQFACKIVRKKYLVRSRSKKKLFTEIKLHKAVKHENIVGFESYFEDEDNIYIVLELCQNQTMHELLKMRKRLTELEVMYYISQILSAVRYLHNHSVIHRDLKLGNIFIGDNLTIKIGDFGLAARIRFDGELRRTICGTPNYIAPEILENKQGHTFQADIWSIGVIIYSLLIGKHPFETSDVKTTYKRIKMNAYSFPSGVLISQMAKDLIGSIFVTDPSKRISIEEIFKHPFMTQGTIPRSLPILTLSKKPADTFIRSYIPDIGANGIVNARTEMLKIQQPSTDKIMVNRQLSVKAAKEDPTITPNFATSDAFFPQTKDGFDNKVWIKKFMDYSTKYGVGYYLCNGMFGVYFNDSSKILFDPFEDKVIFIGNKKESQLPEVHLLKDYPGQLDKKVKLLLHFKSYLENNLKLEMETQSNFERVYVKNWIKTHQAYIFKLTNRFFQVIFKDGSSIVMSPEEKRLLFVTKKEEKLVYDMASALRSENEDLVRRVKYVRNMLVTLKEKNF